MEIDKNKTINFIVGGRGYGKTYFLKRYYKILNKQNKKIRGLKIWK